MTSDKPRFYLQNIQCGGENLGIGWQKLDLVTAVIYEASGRRGCWLEEHLNVFCQVKVRGMDGTLPYHVVLCHLLPRYCLHLPVTMQSFPKIYNTYFSSPLLLRWAECFLALTSLL
ncbi:hypothetical protein EYC84_011599 [Monilinia fructicola]|uniref:Uncharacterized protein n=1 Tax=Monilinia fructicola TaxID=38448 RepID=A0A5M9J5M5_MONFR|nr:hypothetical protein EYC84_011599 [Monilinia fructicola]